MIELPSKIPNQRNTCMANVPKDWLSHAVALIGVFYLHDVLILIYE